MTTHNQLILQIQNLIEEQQFQEASKLISANLHQTDTVENADLYHQQARIHFYVKEFDQGVITSSKAINIYTQHKHQALGDAYMVRGYNYHMDKEFPQALENYKLAYEFAISLPDPNYQQLDQYTYSVANILYHYLGQYVEAKTFYTSARDLARQHNDQSREAFFETHIGMANTELGNHEIALTHLQRALELIESKDDPTHLYTILEIARIKLKMKDYTGSLEELKPVLQRALNDEDPFAFASVRFFIVNILYATEVSAEDLQFMKTHLPEEINPESILNHVIPILEEKGHKRHLVEALVLKIKVTNQVTTEILERAKIIAEEEREMPLLRMVDQA